MDIKELDDNVYKALDKISDYIKPYWKNYIYECKNIINHCLENYNENQIEFSRSYENTFQRPSHYSALASRVNLAILFYHKISKYPLYERHLFKEVINFIDHPRSMKEDVIYESVDMIENILFEEKGSFRNGYGGINKPIKDMMMVKSADNWSSKLMLKVYPDITNLVCSHAKLVSELRKFKFIGIRTDTMIVPTEGYFTYIQFDTKLYYNYEPRTLTENIVLNYVLKHASCYADKYPDCIIETLN